ncbi:poly polymerase catalytic domain-containing protein [Scleroderma citrinum]
MPPRKKATADTTVTKPASARTTRSSAAQQTGAVAKPASAAAALSAPKPKSNKGKRARADNDSQDESPSKKAKIDDQAEGQAEVSVPKEEPKKMVTVLKRGKAPVDPMSPFVNTHIVYSDSQDVWDAMLNQTEVGSNKNKFYVIQLLHPIGSNSSCTLYTRWGRVGENGQKQEKGPWPSAMAINEFKKQFRSKTGVAWERRAILCLPSLGKYMWLERSFEDDGAPEQSGSKKEDRLIPQSTLSAELQDFCSLIFSSKLLDAHLSSMNYDANKLPLGKLAKSTILNGFSALKKLAEVLDKIDGDLAKSLGGFQRACEQLSGEYYSIIPHAFGRNRPTVINEMNTLKKELDLVDALGDMEVAHKLISENIDVDDNGNPLNPLDAHFRSLGLSKMEPISQSSKEFQTLVQYATNTHGDTHYFKATVLNVFRVERESETNAWTAAGFDRITPGNRMLLWHGSRTTNFAGILKQGLRIAPPEAPVSGYMFGKGVYFADILQSANYCHAYLSNNVGILLLCEVAVKPYLELTSATYDADVTCKTANMLATKGVGITQPTEWQDAGAALENPALQGCHMPKGPASRVSSSGAYLLYNEYIVYDPAQIRLRYLLMMKMD